MDTVSIIFLSIGLGMDCFAISTAQGIATAKRPMWSQAVLMAVLFGVFQAGMPLISFCIGELFTAWITRYNHWIAFGLLLLIGANMIIEGLRGEAKEVSEDGRTLFRFRRLIVLAIATSIDALSIGIVFVPTPQIVPFAFPIIGLCSSGMSLTGYLAGIKIGRKISFPTEIIGGIVLIGIGVKILLESLL